MENTDQVEYIREIKWLTYKKLFGNISQEEEQYLAHEIETNPNAALARNQAQAEYDDKEVQEYISRPEFQNTPDWENITIKPQPYFNRRRRIVAMVAVAATLGTLFFMIYPKLRTVSGPDGKIYLTTAKGQKIAIPGNGKIDVNGTVLNAQDSTLNLSAVASSGNRDINSITVPSGFDYKIKLSDGTLVWMNSETKLDFPFTFSGNREITLSGEAYLEVAEDANHPFIVHMPGGKQVRVLGTSFNVNTYDAATPKVALVDGSISVKSSVDSSILGPGSQASIGAGDITVVKFDEQLVLSWREGIYNIQSQKMADVAKVLSRWYGTKVTIDNPKLGDQIFSGRLNRKEPITVFLDKAKEVVGFDYQIDFSGNLHIK